MRFEVIPALDISAGRLVRMSPRGPVPLPAFDGDPLRAARAFAEAGAELVHLVDVDLALTGKPGASDLLGAVAATGVAVQASGGIATAAQVDAMLAAGASRVVLGSGPLGSKTETAALLDGFGGVILVGIEAVGEAIEPRGGGAGIPLWETVSWLSELAVPGFVFTRVGRVGSLGGPDLDGVRELARLTGRPVFAAGGVRGVHDLRAIAGIGGTVRGAIVGRALYEGLDPREALSALR